MPGHYFLITSCHTLSLLITPYPLGLKENRLMLANFKLVPRPLFSYHILSRLVTPYPLGWKQNHFHLATLKLDARSLFSYHILPYLVTPYHSLSPRLEGKPFDIGKF